MADVDLEAAEFYSDSSSDDDALALIVKIIEARPHLAPTIADFMIPGFTLAPARAITEGRHSGTIKNFDATRGYGFIDCPELKELFGSDVWLHHEQVGAYSVGEFVEFAALLSKDGKPQAFGLTSGKGAKGASHGGKANFLFEGKSCGKGTMGKPFAGPHTSPNIPAPIVLTGMKRQRTSGDAVQRYVGIIKDNFSVEKGFGFISCPELYAVYGCDTWLHSAQKQDFQLGESVEFAMILGKDGKPQAVDLSLPAPRQTYACKGGGKGFGEVHVKGGVNAQWVKGNGFNGKGSKTGAHAGGSAVDEAGDGTRYTGKIKRVMPEKGFGFIECTDLQEIYGRDVWLHDAQRGDFQVDDAVTFVMSLNKNGHPQAFDLETA